MFNGRLWSEARTEYAQLLPQLSGADRERAELRILECGVALGGGVSAVAALQIGDPDVDAERFFTLAQYYRNVSPDSQMPQAVESAATRAPQSRWAEQALFLAGNYYWVQLDRDRASGYYKRVADNFPTSPDAVPSQWRVAWTAVLKRTPDAASLLAEHLRRFPGSQFTPDALYWLGRLAEEANNPALARAYYGKLQTRYPQNYFESLAVTRSAALGNGVFEDPDVLATIPAVPPAAPMGDAIPAAAADRQARADALRTIAFDSSAELELRAAYAATGEPRLLLEAAQEAIAAGHCGVAIVAVRQIFTQLESRPFDTVPREVWLAAYPMPFAGPIHQWSAHAGLDPSLTAGLIRQESAFDPEARSGANAFGLMQLLPKTARRLARSAKIGYSRATPCRSGLQRATRHALSRRVCKKISEVWNRRWPRTMREKIASRNGMQGRTTAKSRSLWIRFRSPRLASTSKSSRATPAFIANSTERSRRMNPVKAERAIATSARLSAKAAQFTESVIREMTRLALQYNAVNLSQGFPDFPAPAEIKRAAQEAIAADINQYAITWGAKSLRNAIAEKFERTGGFAIDPEREITVCCGSTEAMMSSMMAIINPGDEVVVFEPFYENYGPDAILSGATPRFVKLHRARLDIRSRGTGRGFHACDEGDHPQHAEQSHGKSFRSRLNSRMIRDLCVRSERVRHHRRNLRAHAL